MNKFLLFFVFAIPILGFSQEEADCSGLNEIVKVESDTPAQEGFQKINKPEFPKFKLRPSKRTWLKSTSTNNIRGKRIVKKSRAYVDWDWLGFTFIYLGGLIVLGGFALIILTTILPWWWFLVGIGAIVAGAFVSAGGAGIIGDKESGFMALGVMFGAAAIGFCSLIAWGLVELILWIVG
ncbi:MAG: hypothetical protein ABJG68_06810 [Crocinitomicaceae bacterium]